MSQPARALPELAPAPRRTAPAPRRTTPAPRRTTPAPRPASRSVRRRRRLHPAFLVFAGVIVTVLVVGVVALNALLAQTAFHMREAEARVADLQRANVRLTDEAARLSSPVEVATWARRHGMVTPTAGSVHVLQVPGSGR